MTNGYQVEIVETTSLTILQKADLLAKCKDFLMVDGNGQDTVINDLILKEIKSIEHYTSNFLFPRKVKISVLSVDGIFDLSYYPIIKTPSPVFSDGQAIQWGAGSSLVAYSIVPVSVEYWAGYSEMPIDFQYIIFENLRLFFDREDKLSVPDKIKAMAEYRKYALSDYRLNALISSYV